MFFTSLISVHTKNKIIRKHFLRLDFFQGGLRRFFFFFGGVRVDGKFKKHPSCKSSLVD